MSQNNDIIVYSNKPRTRRVHHVMLPKKRSITSVKKTDYYVINAIILNEIIETP